MIPVMIAPSQVLFILALLALIASLGTKGRSIAASVFMLLSIATGLVEWLS